MVYIIFLCLTIPMLLMLPLLEIRSRCIVGFMLLGTSQPCPPMKSIPSCIP